LEKIQKKLISHLNPITVEQNYQQYKINKELKLKEKKNIFLSLINQKKQGNA
jgi:hypothetical protein